jgi:uncharacterized protein
MPIFEQQIYNLKTGVHSMHSYLKTRPVWIQMFLFVGLSFGIFMIFSLFGVTILTKMTGLGLAEIGDISSWKSDDQRYIFFVRGMLLVQFLGLFCIPALLFSYFSDPKPMAYVGLKSPEKFAFYLVAAAVLVFALPLVEWLGSINHSIPFPDSISKWMKEGEEQANKQIQFMLTMNSKTDLFLNLIFIACFAAFGEELVFRGVIQRLVIKVSKNPLTGIIITAAIFSAIHLQFYGFLPRFFLGILLGMIYWYSGSLWPAIFAHFIYDAFWVVMSYFKPSLIMDETSTLFTSSGFVLPVLVSFTAVTGLVLWMRKNSETTYEKVYANDDPEKDHPFDSN